MRHPARRARRIVGATSVAGLVALTGTVAGTQAAHGSSATGSSSGTATLDPRVGSSSGSTISGDGATPAVPSPQPNTTSRAS